MRNTFLLMAILIAGHAPSAFAEAPERNSEENHRFRALVAIENYKLFNGLEVDGLYVLHTSLHAELWKGFYARADWLAGVADGELESRDDRVEARLCWGRAIFRFGMDFCGAYYAFPPFGKTSEDLGERNALPIGDVASVEATLSLPLVFWEGRLMLEPYVKAAYFEVVNGDHDPSIQGYSGMHLSLGLPGLLRFLEARVDGWFMYDTGLGTVRFENPLGDFSFDMHDSAYVAQGKFELCALRGSRIRLEVCPAVGVHHVWGINEKEAPFDPRVDIKVEPDWEISFRVLF